MSSFPRSPDLINRVQSLEKKDKKRWIDEYDPDERPGAVTGVDLDYRVREKKTDLRYNAIVTWNAIAPGTCQADINYYVIELESTDKNGNPQESGRKRRDFYIVKNDQDLEPDNLKSVFRNLAHPNKWYYRARVRVVDVDNRKGVWSDWTTHTLPKRSSKQRPPWPDGVALDFDKNEKDRSEPRWRAIVRFSEIEFWDIPPTGNRDKVSQNLSGILAAGASEITLGSVTGLPTPLAKEDIPLAIRPGNEDVTEIVSYSGINAAQNKLTGVDRGLEGTLAREHPDGANVVLSAADAQERQNDLQGYEAQIRRTDKNGNWVLDANGKFIQRSKIHPWKAEADDNDGLVKVVFANVRRRHYWKARARTIDTFGRRGKWSAWTDHGNPLDSAPPMPTDLVVDVDPRKINLLWDAPNDPDDEDVDNNLKEMDPDISYFQVQVSDRSDFDKALSGYWRSDRYHKTMHKTFKKKKKQKGPFYVRVRSVGAGGKKSNWLTSNKQRKRPGTPRNVTKESDVRAVIFKWDPPNSWDDGTTEDWDESEVAYYRVDVYQNGVPDASRTDVQVLTTRKRVKVPKGSSGWSAKVTAVGHEADTSTISLDSGTATDETLSVGGTEIDPGAIAYQHIASSMPAMATPASYATSQSTLNGVNRTRLSTGPSGYKTGDHVMNTSDNKLYKLHSDGIWWMAVDGGDITAESVTANKITTGTLLAAVTVSGSLFIPAASGARLEILGSGTYRIAGYDTYGNRNFYIDSSGNAYFKGTVDSATGTLKDPSVQNYITFLTGAQARFHDQYGSETGQIYGQSGELKLWGGAWGSLISMETPAFVKGNLTSSGTLKADTVRSYLSTRPSFTDGIGIPSGAEIRFNDTYSAAGTEFGFIRVDTPSGQKKIKLFNL